MTEYGYARVSTKGQDLSLQVDALKKYGIHHKRIFQDKKTGTTMKREGFEHMDSLLKSGDTIVVWKLDRLGRSMDELIAYVLDLQRRGINIKSLTQEIDTTTVMGKAFFYMFAIFGEMEHEFVVERVNAGLASARSRGKRGGRPRVNQDAVRLALKMHASGDYSIKEVLAATGLSQGTFYRYLNAEKDRARCRETSRWDDNGTQSDIEQC